MKIALNLLFLLVISVVYSSQAIEGSIGFEKFYRVNIPETTNDSQDWLEFNVNSSMESTPYSYEIDADLRIFINDDIDRNYSLPVAWGSAEFETHKFTLGRIILDWHANEEFWQLGDLNGVQGFSLLDTKQEGIVGANFEFEFWKNWNLQIFLSYIYIPTLNPSISVENGEVTSTSEWVRLPPKETTVNGVTVPIQYELNYPNIDKVIFQKTLGSRLAYNWGSGEFSGFAIYKPENDIRVNAEASYDPAVGAVVVNADPIVNHHLMLGVQLEQNYYGVNYTVGMDVTDPNARLGKDFKSLDPIKLEENNKTYHSEFFSVEPSYVRESYFHSSATWSEDYLALSFNYIKLLSSNVRGSDDFFETTVKWKSAFGLGYSYTVNDLINISGVFRYDIDREDNIFKNEVGLNLDTNVNLIIGFELLKAPLDTSYWSAYRANDTIYSSLNYFY
jgi:hypothetical protein